jgi:hypothetical protein
MTLLDRYFFPHVLRYLAAVIGLAAAHTLYRSDMWLGCNLAASALLIFFARHLFDEAVTPALPPAPSAHALPADPATHDGAFGVGAVATREG